jgi:ribonuclease HI
MQKDTTGWKRMQFKGNKVWAAVDQQGNLDAVNGKVKIKYRLDQDYEYRVHRHNLAPIDGTAAKATKKSGVRAKPRRMPPRTAPRPSAIDIPETAIRIYTDGASSGNPGPSGIGVLMCHGDKRREISEYIGPATNNIAELKAIQVGLEKVKNRKLPVRLFTDSSYAYGLLVLGWRPKKNRELVGAIRSLMTTFEDLQLIKVKGHAGHEGNERADFLATSAIKAAE